LRKLNQDWAPFNKLSFFSDADSVDHGDDGINSVLPTQLDDEIFSQRALCDRKQERLNAAYTAE
jgi:hypothetical protein